MYQGHESGEKSAQGTASSKAPLMGIDGTSPSLVRQPSDHNAEQNAAAEGPFPSTNKNDKNYEPKTTTTKNRSKIMYDHNQPVSEELLATRIGNPASTPMETASKVSNSTDVVLPKGQEWIKFEGRGNFLYRTKATELEVMMLMTKGVITPEDIRFPKNGDNTVKGLCNGMQIKTDMIPVVREALGKVRYQKGSGYNLANPELVIPNQQPSVMMDPSNEDQMLFNDNVVQCEFAKPTLEPESESREDIVNEAILDLHGKDEGLANRLEDVEKRADAHAQHICENHLDITKLTTQLADGLGENEDRIEKIEEQLGVMANALKAFSQSASCLEESRN